MEGSDAISQRVHQTCQYTITINISKLTEEKETPKTTEIGELHNSIEEW